MPSHITEAQQAVLDGRDPAQLDPATGAPLETPDPAFVKHHRVEAAWAKAHDIAADAFGGDPTQFFGPGGNAVALWKALDGAPVTATAGELVALAQAAVEKAAPQKPKGKVQGPAEPAVSGPDVKGE